jgi:hypothetical protein
VKRVEAVRSIGLDVGVDFHGRLHKGMAKQLAKLLESHKPMFIEGGVFFNWNNVFSLEFPSHSRTLTANTGGRNR